MKYFEIRIRFKATPTFDRKIEKEIDDRLAENIDDFGYEVVDSTEFKVEPTEGAEYVDFVLIVATKEKLTDKEEKMLDERISEFFYVEEYEIEDISEYDYFLEG